MAKITTPSGRKLGKANQLPNFRRQQEIKQKRTGEAARNPQKKVIHTKD